MCIRDSALRRPGRVTAEVAASRAHGRRPPEAGLTPAACSCLLYTSDAADDLLCVDLGGRRIIKKKRI